jgi:hypothetical protein
MTLREMIDNGVTFEGYVKIQCWENENNPTIYYEGYINEDGTKAFEEYLDRDVRYIFPYVINVGKCVIGAICIEIEEE